MDAMRTIQRTIAVLAALALSACYVSKEPLITPATADYPIADGAYLAAPPPDKGKYAGAGRTMHRDGAYYTYTADDDAEKSPPFLVKRVAPKSKFFVAQMNDKSDPKKTSEYYYELLEFDGKNVVQYQGTCTPKTDWTTRKLLDRVEDTSSPRCIVSDFAKLATVLQEAAKRDAPEAKFTLAKKR